MTESRLGQLVCAGAMLAALGCEAGIGADERKPGEGGPNDPGNLGPGEHPEDCRLDVGSSVMRRLSKNEYAATMQDLFQLPALPAVDQVPDDGEQGGFNTIAAIQTVSDGHLRAYVEIAETLAKDLMQDAARRATVLGCDSAAAGCLDSFIASFGKLAYRRALDADEVTALSQRATSAGLNQNDQFQLAMEALLTSPSFLFRVEIGDNQALATLTSTEVASRLSFTLWGRGPTADLLARGEAGEFDTDEGIRAAADQMILDPKAQTFFSPFFRQWLDYSVLRVPNSPPPGYSEALMPDMIAETDALLNEYAWTTGMNFSEVLTSNHTFVTAALAPFYGLTAAGSDLVRVDFPAGHNRENTGLLTHAAVISSKTDADLISSRGKWIRQAFLCEHIEPPANLLDAIAAEVAGLSYPEVVQKRNTQEGCSNCHAQIDPVGVGLTQYDAAGYFTGVGTAADYGLVQKLEGAETPDFTTVSELASKLTQQAGFAPCMAEKVFVYTQGREPEESDKCTLDDAGARFNTDGGKFGSLVASLVETPSFRQRRAPIQ